MYKIIASKGMFHVLLNGHEVACFKSFIRLAEFLIIESLTSLSIEAC